MNSQEVLAFKLSSALKECQQHQKWLHSAWLDAVSFSILKEGSIDELTDSQVRTLDQLLFRFGKLQDAIGVRLLPSLLKFVQEWQDNAPFLDQLNRAEKLGFLSSVQQWQRLRELRNQSAHEYPEQPEIMMLNLRRLVEHVPILENISIRLAEIVQQRTNEPTAL